MNFVAYFRVSTAKQGESGLGLEGQMATVEAFSKTHGGTIMRCYTEIESGKKSDRQELARALGHAKRAKATLIVAKLDRLARNVAFTSQVMESGVEFICCDNPHANRLTIHILAAVAENEAKQISERTKSALQAAKARGMKLGSSRPGHWDGIEHKRRSGLAKAQERAAQVRVELANEAYADIAPMMKELRDAGETLQSIADKLNNDGHTTRRGKPWNQTQVSRVLGRKID